LAEEGRRRKSLTPLQSELQPPADWTPPGPVAEQYKTKVKQEKRAPTTTRGMVLQGTKRFLFIGGALATGAATVGILIEYFSGATPGSVFPLVFYITGAVVMAGAAYMTLEGPGWADYEYGIQQEEKESWIANALAPVSLGLTLIGIGVALEVFLF
jgi:hypothetical protein